MLLPIPSEILFVVADKYSILKLVPTGKRYSWLDKNYPDASASIKEAKDDINASEAHANLIATHNTFRADYEEGVFETPFFDVEDAFLVKVDLVRIGMVARVLMQAFAEISERWKSVEFIDDFWPSLQTLGEKNNTLRDELMATDRFKRASEREEVRQADKAQNDTAPPPDRQRGRS